MLPEITTISEKKLIGQRVNMNLANNKTALLFRDFMPRRKEIINSVNKDVLCLQVYEPPLLDFSRFNLETLHDKWAAIEVTDLDYLPENMEKFILPAGLYAVFHYVGMPGPAAADFFKYIFNTWLPASEYVLDGRPHFEIIGAKYKNNDPDSEEDIYIPIKKKQ